MVVTSVRDYLRKMSEAAEKPPPSVRGSIHDSSTVSALNRYIYLPSNTHCTKEWVAKPAVGKLFRPAQFENENGHESEGLP
jgi:hypothetical protein